MFIFTLMKMLSHLKKKKKIANQEFHVNWDTLEVKKGKRR